MSDLSSSSANESATSFLTAFVTIAQYTLLEAVRGRVLVIGVVLAVCAFAAGAYLRQIAMTEGAEIQATIIAAGLRLCSVFLLTSFAVASMVREWNDKGVELLLAQPMPRAAYVFGRFAGFALTGVALAIIVGIPLAMVAPLQYVAAWALSLALECAILAAAAVFFTLTLTQFVGAFAACAALYVLARAMDSLRLLASVAETNERFLDRAADAIVAGIAMLLPSLGRMTASGWLTNGLAPGDLLNALTQAVLYCALLLVAAVVDFYRKNL